MKKPGKEDFSIERVLSSGETKRYPCLNDYIEVLVREGTVQDTDELIENRPELIPLIQRHWLTRNQTGCLFATALAGKEDQSSWYDEVFLDTANEPAYEKLNAAITGLSDKAQAIQVILPTLITPTDICRFLSTLCLDKQWYLSRIPSKEKKTNPVMEVGLRWHLVGGQFVSWVLGFAPFDSMPFTRRAPFTAIIWRTKGPGRCPKIVYPEKDRPIDDASGLRSVHLADLPDGLSKDEQVIAWWQRTEEGKEDLLATDELRSVALAKVTFAFPGDFEPEANVLLQDCLQS